MRVGKKSLVLTIAGCLVFPVSAALASQLEITDCDGNTRAIQDVKSNTKSRIELQVSDSQGQPASGIDLNLSNSVSKVEMNTTCESGTAVFDGISEGTWQVCPKTDSKTGIQIKSVKIDQVGGTDQHASNITRGAIGSVVGAGAVGGILFAMDGSSGSSSDEVAPSGETITLAGSSAPQPEVVLVGSEQVAGPASAPKRRPKVSKVIEDECFEDVEPTPLSVFE